jgi:hypothetical protein
MAGIDVHEGKGKFAWPKGLQGQVDKGDGILPAAEQKRRAFELACDFPENVDRFRLQLVQVI